MDIIWKDQIMLWKEYNIIMIGGLLIFLIILSFQKIFQKGSIAEGQSYTAIYN